MLLDQLVNQTTIPVLTQVMQFAAARHEQLTQNIANIDTPGYKVRDLSVSDFQQSLAKALDERGRNSGRLVLGGRQVRTGRDGRTAYHAMPVEGNNVLFGDGANRQIERQMAALAENTLTYNTAAELLRVQFAQLKVAIRGTVG
ncbi:MAG: hypothetical protein BIFFINMI_03043 [Phycisphaerae bacterium]|nr:hypothetical protein [Phycisphaerae bacterium]